MEENNGYTQPVKLEGTTIFRALENRKGVNKSTDLADNFEDLYCSTFKEAYKGNKGKHYINFPIK